MRARRILMLLVSWALLTPSIFADEVKPMGIQEFFHSLSKNTLNLVDDFYDSEAQFEDPVVSLRGTKDIRKYYAHQYENLISIRFDFTGELGSDSEKVVFWTMTARHARLKSGKEDVVVPGSSHIKRSPTSHKVIYHRDYFDVGAFVYENVPVLGSLTRYVKGRLKNFD